MQQHAASFIAHTEASTGSELPRFFKDEFGDGKLRRLLSIRLDPARRGLKCPGDWRANRRPRSNNGGCLPARQTASKRTVVAGRMWPVAGAQVGEIDAALLTFKIKV